MKKIILLSLFISLFSVTIVLFTARAQMAIPDAAVPDAGIDEVIKSDPEMKPTLNKDTTKEPPSFLVLYNYDENDTSENNLDATYYAFDSSVGKSGRYTRRSDSSYGPNDKYKPIPNEPEEKSDFINKYEKIATIKVRINLTPDKNDPSYSKGLLAGAEDGKIVSALGCNNLSDDPNEILQVTEKASPFGLKTYDITDIDHAIMSTEKAESMARDSCVNRLGLAMNKAGSLSPNLFIKGCYDGYIRNFYKSVKEHFMGNADCRKQAGAVFGHLIGGTSALTFCIDYAGKRSIRGIRKVASYQAAITCQKHFALEKFDLKKAYLKKRDYKNTCKKYFIEAFIENARFMNGCIIGSSTSTNDQKSVEQKSEQKPKKSAPKNATKN